MSSSDSTSSLPSGARAGLGLALISAASFSTAGSFARSLTDAGWSPGAAVAARVSVAAAILAIPALLAIRGQWQALRRNLGLILVYGIITVAGCQLFYFNAVQRLSVGVALLLEYLGIVLIVGWMWLRHGHKPRRLTVIGSLVALLGLVLVIDILGESHLDAIGVMWALAGAVGLATYFVLSAKSDDALPAVVVASGGMTVGAIALFALGALGLLPMNASFGTVELAGRQTAWWVPIAGLSLVAAAIAYVAGIGAARRLGAKLAGFIGLTELLFAVLFAWILLGELPTVVQLAGGALIVAGVALVRIDELRSPAVDQNRAETMIPAVVPEPTSGAAVTPRGAVT